MAELVKEKTKKNTSMHWGWIPGILVRPKKTITNILAQEKPVWLTPLLVIAILVILSVLVSAPIQRVIIQTNANIPENFDYWTPEEQERFYQSQATKTSPVFLYLLPVLQGVAGYWLVWFLLSSILHLIITLAGSRASRQKTSNLVAWTMTPFILRLLIRIVVILASKSLPLDQGLASLAPSAEGAGAAYLQGILGRIDAYYIWHIVLVFLGAVPLSGLGKSKAFWSVFSAVVIMLLLQALPDLISFMLSGLSLTQSYFFF